MRIVIELAPYYEDTDFEDKIYEMLDKFASIYNYYEEDDEE